jgi:hypothetical protein
MTDLLGSLLLLSMLALMAARTVSPVAAKVSGTTLLDLPVRPVFRLLDQRVNIIAILAVLILGSGLIGERWISHGMFLFAVIVMIGLLLVPRHYRLTTEGISPNRAMFRAWDEFTGWEASGNVIRLKGADRFGSLRLYVSEEDRETVCTLIAGRLLKAPKTPSLASSTTRAPRRLAREKGGTK